MLKELEEMSIGQKFYNYHCKSCGFEKDCQNFLYKNLEWI